jgi:hypothetical protein
MIAELPQTPDLARLIGLINERLRTLDKAIETPTFTGNIDMQGNRIVNLGQPKAGTDAARQADATRRTIQQTTTAAEREWVFVGTHAIRVGTSAAKDGSLFYETDRTVLYVSVSGVWKYCAGAMAGTLSPDQKPTDLGADDVGFLFDSTDYLHTYRWSGSAWAFAPNDPGSAYIVAAGGSAPLGGLWGACDGTTYNIASSTGTVTTAVSPDLSGGIFVMGGTYTGSRVVAARAKWEATAKTADESTHTHDVDPAGVDSAQSLSSVAVAAGTDHNVTPSTHTHNVDVANTTSTAGAAHSHALNDTVSQLKVPNEANGGLPIRIALAWYIRR